MNRLKNHRVFLEVLSEADELLFKAMIKASSEERIDIISEICKNVLGGFVKLNPTNKDRLLAHADIIRSVASKKFKTRTRRQLMIKHSTIIATLLKAVFKKIFKQKK